ncbi:hypothetical protein XENOCAPTIV_021313 [Xenoophorus captivus]|uniref:Uncharacterized protein n=1 Tax=Xenoophorus captivus TaxID=1517983 RepID=A0ABV0S2Q8_9TELE
MSPLLLRAFVNERLTAVVAEILEVFEGAIAKYEEEASNSKQEIDRLRCLLLELQSQRTGVLHQGNQWNPELLHIKEEDHELWGVDQEEQKRAGMDGNVPNLPHAAVGEEREQEDRKPPGQRWNQSSEPDDRHRCGWNCQSKLENNFILKSNLLHGIITIFLVLNNCINQSSPPCVTPPACVPAA